jgi:transposase
MCPDCGSIYQRDTNAARNIISLGITAMKGLPRPAELRPTERQGPTGEESDSGEQQPAP